MPFFDTTRFQGTLSGHGSRIPVGFDATVDDLGVLRIRLDPIPFSSPAYALYVSGRSGTAVDLITIEGRSEAGHIFWSDSFHIGQFSHGSQPGEELSYQGGCHRADLKLPVGADRAPRPEARKRLVRQFRTFRHISHETPLGRVVIGGPRQDREVQDPNGFILVRRPEDGGGEGWWAESERLLTHIARVLSFACDTYLRPVIEERYHAEGITVRVVRQGHASAPYMAPFYELHMEPIFACACDSYFARHETVVDLDAAIRWLTAPAVYDESRLINAMSALENILNRCGLEDVDTYMGSGAFKRVASCVRATLGELGVPEGMSRKVPELNRRTLGEKVMALLRARGIILDDMPENWLATVIRQRNIIVHTGVSGDLGTEHDTFVHTIWVREVVTRIILERLGFEGAFRSWLNQDEQLHFPECIRMEEWLARLGASAPDPRGITPEDRAIASRNSES